MTKEEKKKLLYKPEHGFDRLRNDLPPKAIQMLLLGLPYAIAMIIAVFSLSTTFTVAFGYAFARCIPNGHVSITFFSGSYHFTFFNLV